MLARLASAAKRRPVRYAAVALGSRYFAGDLFTQLVVEQRTEVDRRRLTAFTLYGTLMGGLPIYAWFGILTPWATAHFQTLAAKCACFIAMDFALFMPFVYFPAFYAIREVVYHDGADAAEVATAAFTKYRTNLVGDMSAAVSVLLPQDIAIQTFVPPHLRVPFVAVTGMVWVVLFSSVRGSEEEDAAARAPSPTAKDAEDGT